MKCPNCRQQAQNIRTAIHKGKLITTCEHCANVIQPHQLAAKNRREQQKKDFRGDLIQPTQKREFSKLYPEEARDLYGDDEFRKLA